MTPSSPRVQARLAGLLYLVVILGGAFADAYVRQRFTVPGDAAATAANILGNPFLWRLGFVADLIPLLCNVVLAVLFYDLFRIVDRRMAQLVVFFSLAGSAIQAAVLLFHLAPLLILQRADALAALGEAQRQALAYFCLRLQGDGYNIALAFFGGFGVSIGSLILRARFMPRLIGGLMMIAGACYFTNAMLGFLAPQLSSLALLLPCLVGEGTLTLWLLLAGVNSTKWQAQAAAAA